MALEQIKEAIDNSDMDYLFELAIGDVLSFFGKLTVRQLGKKRCERLYTKCEAIDEMYQDFGEERKDKFVLLILARLKKEALF